VLEGCDALAMRLIKVRGCLVVVVVVVRVCGGEGGVAGFRLAGEGRGQRGFCAARQAGLKDGGGRGSRVCCFVGLWVVGKVELKVGSMYVTPVCIVALLLALLAAVPRGQGRGEEGKERVEKRVEQTGGKGRGGGSKGCCFVGLWGVCLKEAGV